MARSILIADDSAAIRDVLREALVDEGYDVAEVSSGDGVLAALDRDIGDTITVGDAGEEYRVVGRVIVYGVDTVDDDIAVTPEGFARLGADPSPEGAVIRLEPGADEDEVLDRLSDRYLGVDTIDPPSIVDNLDELGSLPTVLAVFLVLSVVIGVLAAVFPARRAARLDVLRAIATE